MPAPVTGFGPGSGVVDIAAGFEGGLALKDDGTVWAWGCNANGSLNVVGVAGGHSAPAPLQVPLPPGPPVVDIDMHDACHALALRADGSVLSWGCDFFGQAGNGADTGGAVSTPTLVSMPGASAVGIAASVWNLLVLTRPTADTAWERPATWVKASVADATVDEHEGGRFTVTLSDELPYEVTVGWRIAEGTAGGGDVTLGDGTATVPAGSRTVDVDVTVLDDAVDEDDDSPPTVSIESATVAEGDTSLTDATVGEAVAADRQDGRSRLRDGGRRCREPRRVPGGLGEARLRARRAARRRRRRQRGGAGRDALRVAVRGRQRKRRRRLGDLDDHRRRPARALRVEPNRPPKGTRARRRRRPPPAHRRR